jgi:glycosyltransferase involved in cell wall biosynthesis
VKVLFVASRSPWPPTDGGRVLMGHTIDGLLARGHDITVVATGAGRAAPAPPPVAGGGTLTIHLVPERRRPLPISAVASLVDGQPLSVAAQPSRRARDEAAVLLANGRFDVVHVQQVQALPKAEPALARHVPVVLRAENVESELWSGLAAVRPSLRPFAAFEAGRLARFEARAMLRVSATVALTEADAARLRRLAPGARVEIVPAPMPAGLPAGAARLPGDPSLVLVSSGWFPNQDGVVWFVRAIWPAIAAALPQATLHVFGAVKEATGAAIERHDAPADSQAAFAEGSVLIVPLRMGSGVRIRILEAWSRGVPVVGTTAAVDGLGVADGQGVRIADSSDAFIRALQGLHASANQRAQLIARGREILAARHDPAACAAGLEAIYLRAIASNA